MSDDGAFVRAELDDLERSLKVTQEALTYLGFVVSEGLQRIGDLRTSTLTVQTVAEKRDTLQFDDIAQPSDEEKDQLAARYELLKRIQQRFKKLGLRGAGVLLRLMEQAGTPVTNRELMRSVRIKSERPNVIRVYVCRLRRDFGVLGFPNAIETISKGYCMRADLVRHILRILPGSDIDLLYAQVCGGAQKSDLEK